MNLPPPPDPIFIHGVLPRSGTNFLCDLLLLHPDCTRARAGVDEDLFLEHSDHLLTFTRSVREAWDPAWGPAGSDVDERFHASLGDGLVSFLWANRAKRLVTKSPSVRHLDRFFTFFPTARLLILMRDGRSVAESAMKTFGWDLDRAARAWAEGARTVQRFEREEASRADRWRLVRYEDLVDDPEPELRRLFAFLDLDATRYDFVGARSLPVRGSSAFGRGQGKVHWTRVARDTSFAPKERWRGWSPAQLERFEWLAGTLLAEFGYTPPRRPFTAPRSAAHTLRDWWWQASVGARRMTYRLRGRVALRSRLAAVLRERGVRHAAR